MTVSRFLVLFPLFGLVLTTAVAEDTPGPMLHREHQQANTASSSFRALSSDTEGSFAPITLNRRVFGWIPYWERNDISDLSLTRMDTAAWFSYEVIPDTGGYTTTHNWLSEPVVDRALATNRRTVLTVTNFGFSNNAALLGNPSARSQLINNLVNLVRQRNAQGVNIDFENIRATEGEELVAFLTALTARMHAEVPGSEVSIALPARDWSGAFDGAAISAVVDLGIIMGYAYRVNGSAAAGPVAPLSNSEAWGSLSLETSIQEYLNEGFDRNKLVLGLPTYGVQWPTVTTQPGAPASSSGRAIFYGTIAASTFPGLARNNDPDRRVDILAGWDTPSATPYYIYTDNPGDPLNQQTFQGWFEDTDSLNEKMNLADSYDLAGIAFWAVGYENQRPELWDLIEERYGEDTPQWETFALGTTLYDVAYDGNRFLTVGAAGAVFSSPDGRNWSAEDTPVSVPLVGLASSPEGTWIAVGAAGALLRSTQPGDWAVLPSPVSGILRKVAKGPSGWVAVGDNGTILHSVDGLLWADASPAGLTATVLDVAASAERYLAVTAEGTSLTSSDGMIWSSPLSVAPSATLYAVAGWNETFYVSGSNSFLARSVDGAIWERLPLWKPSTLTAIGSNWEGLTAAGANGRLIATRDGHGWYPQDAGSTAFLQAVSYGQNTIVAVASDGTLLRRRARTPFLRWARQEEETHGLPQGVLFDFATDSDNDGLPAALEHLFAAHGYSANAPDPSPFSTQLTSSHLAVSHPAVDLESNLVLAFEASTDGTNWYHPNQARLPSALDSFSYTITPEGAGTAVVPLSASRGFLRWIVLERLQKP